MRIFKKIPDKDILYIRDIVKKYLNDDTVKKIAVPLQNEFILHSKDKEICILISSSYIEIVNHNFSYKREVSLSFSEDLCKLVADKIREDIESLKKELFKNELDLLRKLCIS